MILVFAETPDKARGWITTHELPEGFVVGRARDLKATLAAPDAALFLVRGWMDNPSASEIFEAAGSQEIPVIMNDG